MDPRSRSGIASLSRLTYGLAVLSLWLSSSMAIAQGWKFEAPRVVAVSDVHGDYEAMVATLTAAGVIDADGNWSGGGSALVITGDLLDRGPDSRQAMDLVMALEPQAAEAGGQVHLLLGNHEVMNLVGDLRYVADEEYAAFADDADAEARAKALEAWLADGKGTESEFEKRYAAGFFSHRQAFRADGHYGAWLLQKPVLVVVNDTAFTHGGLSPMVAELGLDGVNALMDDVRHYVKNLSTLIDAGLIDPAENFYDHAYALESVDKSAQEPDVAEALDVVVRLNESDIHGPNSPLWYRGNVGCGALIEEDRLLASLKAIGASRVVIGHTPTLGRSVLSRLDGRVIEIDTGMLSDYYRGDGHALVLEGDSIKVVGEKAGGQASPVTHPRRVGGRPAELSSDSLERLLANGSLSAAGEDDAPNVYRVSLDGEEVEATFVPNPRRNFSPDLVAYRLDRILGLDMVPVTVQREVDGDDGALQYRPPSTMSEFARRESGRGGSAWCPLPDQWDAMYVFDALIHNPARVQDRMLYSPDNWQLILVGHDASFPTSRGWPAYVEGRSLVVTDEWRERLEALTDDVIADEFSDLLDRRRRNALATRRDRLLNYRD